MPEHKSCKKRVRSDTKKRKNNKYKKQRVRNLMKKFRSLEDKKEMEKLLPEVYSAIDKAVKGGVFHKNKGARHKAQVANYMKKFN